VYTKAVAVKTLVVVHSLPFREHTFITPPFFDPLYWSSFALKCGLSPSGESPPTIMQNDC
jgi:hypothetical protein